METVTVNGKDITNLILSFEQYEEIDIENSGIIGSCVSTQIKMKIKNKDGQLNQLLDYPFMIGNKTYIVYERPEKWTKSISLTLYDLMIKTNVAYDTKLEYPVTLSQQIDEMVSISGVNIDKSTLSNELLSKEVGWYDNTMIIRNYIGFIAQCDGKNAYIENNAIVFKKIADIEHDTDFCSDYELNDIITLTRVCYNNGVTIPLSKGDDTGKTLYVNSNNSYIAQEDIDRIYNMYNGLSFYSFKSFKCKDISDISLTHFIHYHDITIMPFSIKKIVHGGEARDTLEMSGNVSLKNVDSVIVKVDPLKRIRRVETIVDQNNARLDIIAKDVDHQTEILKNSISVSLMLNYVSSQTFDINLNKYYPDYTVHPLKITAVVKDGFKESIVDAEVVFKRKTQADDEYTGLIDGEVVNENVLIVSHNLTDSVEYIAYVTVESSGTTYEAESTVSINLNSFNDGRVAGSVCSIEATGDSFFASGNTYNPNNIVLSPQLFNCNFDIWSYSINLGLEYITIIKNTATEDDENIYTTNVEGILFINDTNEIMIRNDCELFDMTNAIVFQLKADINGVSNTVVITKESDVNQQVNDIVNDMKQLVEQYNSLSLSLDGINNSITSKVEEMETKYNDGLTEISKNLSQIIQTSDKIEEQFQTLKEIVDENGGELQTITTYIRKTAKGIEVGELDAQIKTLMGTEYFAILFNEEEAMKLERNLLTIDKIFARESFRLNHSIFTSKEYGFEITWGGD